MEENRWDFPFLGTGSVKGANDAGITMFKSSGTMDGLAREICQNSLDARRKDLPSNEPVTVKFKLKEIKKEAHRDIFDGYEEALKNARSLWTDKGIGSEEAIDCIKRAEDSLKSDTVSVLVMSDYGTTGLTGSKSDEGFWNTLVNAEGVSGKQDKNSAGSFGIGKNAPFAYTLLNMVFYNTYATDEERALQGVTHLVTTQRWSKSDGKLLKASDTGKYLCMLGDYDYRPIRPTDKCTLIESDLFNRFEYGTDVAIFGFKASAYDNDNEGTWEKQLTVALLKNFMLAIKDGKLVAEVSSEREHYIISKENQESLLFKTFSEERQLKCTQQDYKTVTQGSPHNVKICEPEDLTIYILHDERFDRALSRYRSAGMLINTTREVYPHFSVVIVVNDTGKNELSKLLREAEPPQHNEWKAKNVTDDQTLRGKVKYRLRLIRDAVNKLMNEYDNVDIQESVDAGIGSYIPDAFDQSGLGEGTDELLVDVQITGVAKVSPGLSASYSNSAAGATGTKTGSSAHKRGKRKHRKKTEGQISKVDSSKGSDSGAAPGKGKLEVSSPPRITAHRTFLFASNKYHLHIESDEDYENVCIYYNAGREDSTQDPLKIKTYKQDGRPLVDEISDCIGPVCIHRGANEFYFDFETPETLAVIPDFKFGETK